MSGVTVNLANGQLGGVPKTKDGITGLVLTGNADAGGYAVGTPVLVRGLADVANAGITAGSNGFAMKELKDFYTEAGDGTMLYLMLVANTYLITDISDVANPDGAVKLLDYAQGKIKVLGIMTDDTTVSVTGVTSGINDDVVSALPTAQALGVAYFYLEKPFRIILGGTSYQGTPGDLPDLSTYTDNRVAVFIGDTSIDYSAKGAALGLLFGRIAKISVQRKIGRVRDGALSNAAAYLGDAAIETTGSDAATIAGQKFITFATYPNKAGYYFSVDAMAAGATDDYNLLAHGRVIDKAHMLAYGVFIEEVEDEIPVNEDGTIDAGFATWLQQQMIDTVNTAMKAKKEISGCDCYIDVNQNILATSELNVVVKVRPVGYATDIVINLGFEA